MAGFLPGMGRGAGIPETYRDGSLVSDDPDRLIREQREAGYEGALLPFGGGGGGWGGGGVTMPRTPAARPSTGGNMPGWGGGPFGSIGGFGDPGDVGAGGGWKGPSAQRYGGNSNGVGSFANSWFARGGAIPDVDEGMNPMGSSFGAGLTEKIMAARGVVLDVLNYGRDLYGLGSADKADRREARMPAVPGNPSESGVPRERPMPGPLPPTDNPFGKRKLSAIDEGDEGSQEPAQEQVAVGAIDEEDEAA